MRRICFATNNRHKIIEVEAIVGKDFPLLSLAEIGCTEELPEEQPTIEGNSLQKAKYVFDGYQVAALADDSGLEVGCLGGAPGVDSAHYAGAQRSHEDNMNLLLTNMLAVKNRKAIFKTVLTLILDDKSIYQFTGTLDGVILSDKRGTNGFGYDPLFLPDGFSLTLAEMTLEEKSKISHRSRAVQKLTSFLETLAATSNHE